MASAINKVTGKYINRGIGYADNLGNDWIINPTDAEKEQYKYKPPLTALKAAKKSNILNRTEELLNSGFAYDGKTFGSTEKDQTKWNFLQSKILRKKDKGITNDKIYPINNKVRDINGSFVDIPDNDYLDELLDAGELHYDNIMSAHYSIIDQIDNCNTEAELDSIIDNR